jgi:hypothetical protein
VQTVERGDIEAGCRDARDASIADDDLGSLWVVVTARAFPDLTNAYRLGRWPDRVVSAAFHGAVVDRERVADAKERVIGFGAQLGGHTGGGVGRESARKSDVATRP